MYKFCFLQSKMILVISIFRYLHRKYIITDFFFALLNVASWYAVQVSDTTMMP